MPFNRSCTMLQSFQIFTTTWLFSFGKWTCSYSTLAINSHSLRKVSRGSKKPEETRSHTAWVFCRNSQKFSSFSHSLRSKSLIKAFYKYLCLRQIMKAKILETTSIKYEGKISLISFLIRNSLQRES